jgi:hypothetical protein
MPEMIVPATIPLTNLKPRRTPQQIGLRMMIKAGTITSFKELSVKVSIKVLWSAF